MERLKTLIDDAANLCGSDAELGRRIGKTRSQIADMRSGRHPISPETVALLADVVQISGEEARELAALAVIGNPKNADRQGVLRRAFFGSLALGAVAIGIHPIDALALSVSGRDLTPYILCAALTVGAWAGLRRSTVWTKPPTTGRGLWTALRVRALTTLRPPRCPPAAPVDNPATV